MCIWFACRLGKFGVLLMSLVSAVERSSLPLEIGSVVSHIGQQKVSALMPLSLAEHRMSPGPPVQNASSTVQHWVRLLAQTSSVARLAGGSLRGESGHRDLLCLQSRNKRWPKFP